MTTREYGSPCGKLLLAVQGNGLVLCDWLINDKAGKALRKLDPSLSKGKVTDDVSLLDEAVSQLDEYFAGKRQRFDIPVSFVGTEFQQLVWKALLEVPYGRTTTYQAIAQTIGRPSAVRAVANAIGANPVSIFVPCHRIIGSSGALTGYAGGLDAKKYLLELESRQDPAN